MLSFVVTALNILFTIGNLAFIAAHKQYYIDECVEKLSQKSYTYYTYYTSYSSDYYKIACSNAYVKVYYLFIGLGIVYISLSIYFSMVIAAYGRAKRKEERPAEQALEEAQPTYELAMLRQTEALPTYEVVSQQTLEMESLQVDKITADVRRGNSQGHQ
ncbi:12397_t:CDS:2 [Ambispora gerdemannii]|uniref:12397_t:CDS:1 n=1 Tax=Ambispora gerdemannii TaxID=144530 RepID=A0A9N9D8K8_9GLOM|nr:12397_t:CDS:2 [Ambispora gerdemannii]